MRTREFLSKVDHDRVAAAIAGAEGKTSGEIRVYVQRGKLPQDPLNVATQKFQQLGMHKTRERNAVLIFVAPRSRGFAVVGDEGIHQKCGKEFWQKVVDGMRRHFQREDFTEALVQAINDTGTSLAVHFPRRADDVNELPDAIIES